MLIKVNRRKDTPAWTFGTIDVNGVHFGFTKELPDRDNRENESQIPNRTYSAFLRRKAYGWCVQLNDVPGRRAIQLHGGSGSLGCIVTQKEMATSGTNLIGTGHEVLERIKQTYDSLEDKNILVTVRSMKNRGSRMRFRIPPQTVWESNTRIESFSGKLLILSTGDCKFSFQDEVYVSRSTFDAFYFEMVDWNEDLVVRLKFPVNLHFGEGVHFREVSTFSEEIARQWYRIWGRNSVVDYEGNFEI